LNAGGWVRYIPPLRAQRRR
jgi:hypothetical protein